MIYELDGKRPQIGKNCFIAPNASVVGDVHLADNVSIWFGAVIRGDNDAVYVGANSNIQDNCVVHVDLGKQVKVGANVTVGHKAMLHGCEIGDGCLIGINSVILDGAKIGKNCLIGANTLVTEKMEIPDGSLVLGSPARIVKSIDAARQAKLALGSAGYVEEAELYIKTLQAIDD